MGLILVLTAGILLQLIAAVLAIRMVRVTGWNRAWYAICLGMFLMVARRCYGLYGVWVDRAANELDLGYESVGLLVSLLLAAGIVWLAPLFHSIRRSQRNLEESQRRLGALMHNLPGMAYRRRNDERWTMEFVSEGCLALTGCRPDQLVGDEAGRYRELVHLDDVAVIDRQIQQAAATRQRHQATYRIRTNAGEKWVWELGSGVFSEQGELVAIEGFITDVTERRRADQQVEHLNAVLRAIRNVDQVIARERDRDRLLQSVCDSLVQTRGYRFAWVVVLDEAQQIAAAAEAGVGRADFAEFCASISRGETAACLQMALTTTGSVLIEDRRSCCGQCPLAEKEQGCALLAARVAWNGDVIGAIVVAMPAAFAQECEERELVSEVAGDLAFALHNIHSDQRRRRAEDTLRLEQSRLAALVQLNRMAESPLGEITNFMLEESVRLTQSQIGYLAFISDDQSVMTVHAWSRTAMRECAMQDKPILFPVATTGLLAEAVRQRRPVLINDYAAPNPAKSGLPEGHLSINRHMGVPIFDGHRLVAMIGVGNKDLPYDESDVRQLTLLGQGMWQLLERRRTHEQLREARDELEVRVRMRTAELSDANDKLRRERDLLDALMDNVPYSIYFKDAASRFVRVNRAQMRLFGLDDPSAARGKTDADFFDPEHAGQAQDDEQQIMRSGEAIIDKEEKETWPDGRVTWALTTKMPLRNPEGQIVGTFGISRDITEQRSAEEALRTSELRYRTLYDASRDAVMILDPDHGFLAGNPAALGLFGCRDESEFTTLAPADLSPEFQPDGERSAPGSQRMIEIAMREGSHYFEWQHRRIDGRTFPATVLLARMELGGRLLLQATVRDVTTEKRAAEAMQAAKEAAEAAREAAEAASRAKSTFLANMSHEIRTPLNAVIGMTELVLKTSLSDPQREYLAMVKDAGEALLSVINDILDFSKIEAGKLVLQRTPIDLRDSLGDTVKSLALRAHQKKLELAFSCHPDVPRRVLGDYHRLRQIVVNLVGNAIKFTEAGEIVVEVSCQAVEGREVVLRLAVSDTGVGIPRDKQKIIFDVFEQADNALTRGHGGTGLGLAITSRLVEAMGGAIQVESEAGRGACFSCTLRFELAEQDAPPEMVLVPDSLRGLRVLVVDDTATNRRILGESLRHWQMEPVLAASGAEALASLRAAAQSAAPFPLVLTDAHMPGCDGFMLTETIRADASLSATKVIMLTSGDRVEDAALCQRWQIAAYLLKPAKHSELLEAIQRTLGVQVARRALPEVVSEAPTIRPLRILLAEDSPMNQKLAVALLERRGHHVTVAQNGLEAVNAFDRDTFDLILMDVQMPEMDGLKATAAIRLREAGAAHTPIVALTAHALEGDRERFLEAGMDGYVAKPIRPNELYETIATALSSTSNRGSATNAAEAD